MYFDSSGERIQFLEEGEGTSVLLVHGFTGSVEMWTSARQSLLSQSLRVVSVDCRGHGLSDKPHDVAA